jgi:hypothetical protein
MKKSLLSFLSIAGLILVVGTMSVQAQSSGVYAAEYNQATNRFGTIDLVSGNFTRISSMGRALINDIEFPTPRPWSRSIKPMAPSPGLPT